MRRKPKENNFKAVLETIRELMNTECVVPDWLHDIILGYGDPGAAHYSRSVPYWFHYRLGFQSFLVKY
jgi:intron-binding protein aquarius